MSEPLGFWSEERKRASDKIKALLIKRALFPSDGLKNDF
jgi:hypothetical protein